MAAQLNEVTGNNPDDSVDDGGFGAAFNEGVTGEESPDAPYAKQQETEGGQEAPEGQPASSEGTENDEPAEADGGQEEPDNRAQGPSEAQVTQGDGGTPPDPRGAERQQESQGYDQATVNAILERLSQGGQQAGNQQAGAQPAESQQAGGQQPENQQSAEPEVPTDWTAYLTEDQRNALSEYDKEWGEVSQAEQIRTQAMVRLARDQVLSQVQQALNPVYEHMQQAQVSSHFDQVRQAHSDFDEIRNGPLQEWVQGMTNSVMKRAAEETLQQGTTQEVIDLVSMYKDATGNTQASGTSTGAAPAVPASASTPANSSSQAQGRAGNGQGAQAPAANRNPRAASATAAVRSGSRGNDPRGSDPDDFQAGFRDQAANQ